MEKGYLIKTVITVKQLFRKPEKVTTFVVRDGDLPYAPQPYHRIAQRAYATQNKEHGSVWVHRTTAETYMQKHNIKGSIVESEYKDTGYVTNDGRKFLLPC